MRASRAHLAVSQGFGDGEILERIYLQKKVSAGIHLKKAKRSNEDKETKRRQLEQSIWRMWGAAI